MFVIVSVDIIHYWRLKCVSFIIKITKEKKRMVGNYLCMTMLPPQIAVVGSAVSGASIWLS